VTPDAADTWSRIQDELRRTVDQAAYDLWLAALRPRELDGKRLVLTAPDERRRWVGDRFARVLQTCASAVLGPGATVEVVSDDDEPPADAVAPGLDPHGRPDLNPKLSKDAWRATDVLLLDDVQFLESKVRTEEEFFHTFNALYDAGAQLVLTSDRTPHDLAALEDRLRERFQSGLVTEIAHPDHGMRVAILRKRAQQDGLEIHDPAVLDAIARQIRGSVRELEGALIRVVALASLTRQPLTPDLAGEVLGRLYPATARRPGTGAQQPSIQLIQQIVCEQFGLTGAELISTSRAARIAGPRQLAMYLARTHTDASLPAIGAAFGRRNHTTVMHAVRRVEERVGNDPDVADIVRTLTERLADRSG
jgi:chromosomal replication initiator protein DnaA